MSYRRAVFDFLCRDDKSDPHYQAGVFDPRRPLEVGLNYSLNIISLFFLTLNLIKKNRVTLEKLEHSSNQNGKALN
jgi:hypothetical protein